MIQIDAEYIRMQIDEFEDMSDEDAAALKDLPDVILEEAFEDYLGDSFWERVHIAVDYGIADLLKDLLKRETGTDGLDQ